MGAAKQLMQINSGLAFCIGSFASSKIAVKRPVEPEIDPSQIDGPTR
jgi:hypothetical protein